MISEVVFKRIILNLELNIDFVRLGELLRF